jgi:hypothetical protein
MVLREIMINSAHALMVIILPAVGSAKKGLSVVTCLHFHEKCISGKVLLRSVSCILFQCCTLRLDCKQVTRSGIPSIYVIIPFTPNGKHTASTLQSPIG